MPIIFILNTGNFLDVTDKPQKVDILVYLGGGGVERIEKTLKLYNNGYSRTNKIIFTGRSQYKDKKKNFTLKSKKTFFINNGIFEKNLVYKKLGNTLREVRFVKNYMDLKGLKSVIFITDPPHARRVKILANSFSSYEDSGIVVYVVGSDVKWWNKSRFFMNKDATIFVFSESVKILYNYIVYGILEKYGLLPYFKKTFGKPIHEFITSIKVFVYSL